MKTAANSKFMTLFGVHNCRRRAELLASLRPSRILNTYNADTDSRVVLVVPLVVRWLIRPVAVGRRTHSILSLFLRTRRERERDRTRTQCVNSLLCGYLCSSSRRPSVSPSVSQSPPRPKSMFQRTADCDCAWKQRNERCCLCWKCRLPRSALSSLLALSQSHVSSDNGISRGHSLFSFSFFFLLISPF